MVAKKPNDSKPPHDSIIYWAIPRPWLIALVGLLIVLWLGLVAIWLWPLRRSDPREDPPVRNTHVGKWGELTLIPIVISPPRELVFTDWGFMRRPTWFFPGADAEMAARLLQSAGVSADDAARICSEARSEPRIQGVVLSPDPSWVRALVPETRARLYRMLAKSELNMDQNQAFRYPGASVEEWLGSSPISSRTRQLVEPFIYRDGGYMLFSDIELLRSEIESEDELRRLSRALFRQPTVIARLSVDRETNLDALVEYWGRGGRRSEIRPLIESVAGRGSERYIDVIHLLPPFARNRLYCYPELSVADLNKPTVANCLWTSLNFFLSHPDDRFIDGAFAQKTLREDYVVIEADYELGDIVAFLDEKGDIFHAAVHIADDLVFSKNGISAMAPWTLISIDDVKSYYRWRSENPRLIFHRRKEF